MTPAYRKAAWSLGLPFLLVFLAVPPLAIAISLYGQSGLFFWDARTLPCGIEAARLFGDPNAYLRNPDHPGACAGYGYEYMLPPGVTAFLGGLAGLTGMVVLTVAYVLAYLAALAMLGRGALRFSTHAWEGPAFAASIACGAFVFEVGGGNLTILFVGLLCGLILASEDHPRWSLWMVCLCVVAAAFKPLYALYLFIPLFAAKRWLAVAAGAAAVSVGYAADATLHAAEFDRWLALIVPVVYAEAHFGVMRLMQWAGLGAGDWLAQGGAYLAWCALVVGALWRTLPRLASERDRAFAALLGVTLMLPRLKEYDAVVLVPLFFWLRAWLPVRLRPRYQWTVFASAFVIPTLWWWGRKMALLLDGRTPSLTQVADPRWLIATQGFFLTLAVLLMFGFLVWPRAGRAMVEERQA